MEDLRISIELKNTDLDILQKIREAMSSDHPISNIIRIGGYEHVYLDINSKKLCNSLRGYGLASNKSVSMGNIIQYIPDNLKHHFLRGYFDGDGHITYGRQYLSGKKYSVQIIGTEEFLITSFGTYCNTNNKLYKYKTCNMFCWSISKKSLVDDFINYLYKDATIYLNRKFESAHVKPL